MNWGYKHTAPHMDPPTYYYEYFSATGMGKVICARCLELSGTTQVIPDHLIYLAQFDFIDAASFMPVKFKDFKLTLLVDDKKAGQVTVHRKYQWYDSKITSRMLSQGKQFDFVHNAEGYIFEEFGRGDDGTKYKQYKITKSEV